MLRLNVSVSNELIFCVGVLGCLNFLKLCKIKYYNCCLFHSVQVCKLSDVFIDIICIYAAVFCQEFTYTFVYAFLTLYCILHF